MWKTLIKRYIIIVLIGLIISLPVMYYIDAYVLNTQTIAKIATNTADKPTKTDNSGIDLPDEAKNINMSSDGKYLIYIFYSQLTLVDKESKKETTVEDINPVVYEAPLESGKIAFVTNKKDVLTLKEYDINTKESTTICKFTQTDFNGVQDLRCSDGIYYLTVEKRTGGVNTDTVYRIKGLKDYRVYASSQSITNLYVLGNDDSVVYQDANNNIYIDRKLFSNNGTKKYNLLGIDSSNNIYLEPTGDPSNVIVVNGGKVTSTKSLEDANYNKVYSTKNGIFLSYSNYYYDLIKGTKYEIKDKMTLVSITNNGVIYKNTSGKIVIKDN